MDETCSIQSIRIPAQLTTFDKNPLLTVNGHDGEHLSEDFARYFSIDNDDVILLDPSEVILDEVKSTLDHLINDLLTREKSSSQITDSSDTHPLDFNCDGYSSSYKTVRCSRPDDQPPPLPSLFVSETVSSSDSSKSSYAQFLYHLGFDLCLEQNLSNHSSLSEVQKQTLIERNDVFHRRQIYSCKHCLFRTDTIHALNHHYRTPHTLSQSVSPHRKYHCTYCSFQTFRLPVLRRHLGRKHGYQLIPEFPPRRYLCSFCYYESDDKSNFLKHNRRCQSEQARTRLANDLLTPFGRLQNVHGSSDKHKPPFITKKLSVPSLANALGRVNNNQVAEPILIESDHDTSSPSRTSSSDEDFIVSSDDEISSSTGDPTFIERDADLAGSHSKTVSLPPSKPVPSQPVSIVPTVTPAAATLPSLSKLLLLNGTPISSFTLPTLNSTKAPLVSIQPKPATTNGAYQMCHTCQCYIHTKDYLKHMNEKHNNASIPSAQLVSTPISILNNNTNTINTTITCLTPTLIVTKTTLQVPSTIFLLSTTTMDSQPVALNMIKCPWCDTNFEHIDVMTGHLMKYHRMTLAAAKVVVAEQMKIQCSSSSQLTLQFKEEIQQIQSDFTEKIYWKVSQPKVYLHSINTLSCFVCHTMMDDVENHFSTVHQIPLATMNTIKQCCLCGFKCDNNKNRSLFEHQLRTHAGVCYSTVLKQFIRFDPPPTTPKTPIAKDNNRTILPSSPSSYGRSLVTYTEKKFGCRKCATSSRLFTFEELVEHLRTNHELNVKLHRRCIVCQETFAKGTEYNQHCLEHLNEEHPSVNLKRQRVT